MEAILNQERLKRLLLWLAILATGLLLLLPSIQVLASGVGGYISEKLIDRSGVSSSSLVIGMGNPQIDIGMGPSVSTLPAQTTKGINKATLRGSVDSLNSFPSATVWFEWGYSTSYGNTTATQTATNTGEYSTEITGLSDRPVHYRFVASLDGTNYGSDSLFQSTKTATQTLIWLIPTVFAIFGIVVLFALRGSPIAVIIAGILIVIGVLILANIAGVLW